MQAVQIEQLLPQIQSIQVSPQDLKTGDTRFMDELRSLQENEDKLAELPEKEEKTAVKEKADSKKDVAKETPEENQKNEPEEKVVSSAELAVKQMIEQQSVQKDNNELPEDEHQLVVETKNDRLVVSDKLKWLFEVEGKNSSENKIDDELAALIEGAQEFVPGLESEEELLTKAQNFSVTSPREFLENAEKNGVQVKFAQHELSEDKESFSKLAKKYKKVSRFEVSDLRTVKAESKNPDQVVHKSQQRKEFELSYKQESKNSIQVTMDLSKAAEQNITSSSQQSASANGSTFQAMLSNAVIDNAPEFVKAGSIVLRDNNQGSINLVLHPEKLGNVKINLSLSDKVISGQITVHSKEAYEAIKDSIIALKNEFAQNGFETGEFNLNLSNGNEQFAQNHSNSQAQDQQAQFKADRAYSEFVAVISSEDAAVAAYQNGNDYSVNIVA